MPSQRLSNHMHRSALFLFPSLTGLIVGLLALVDAPTQALILGAFGGLFLI